MKFRTGRASSDLFSTESRENLTTKHIFFLSGDVSRRCLATCTDTRIHELIRKKNHELNFKTTCIKYLKDPKNESDDTRREIV